MELQNSWYNYEPRVRLCYWSHSYKGTGRKNRTEFCDGFLWVVSVRQNIIRNKYQQRIAQPSSRNEKNGGENESRNLKTW